MCQTCQSNLFPTANRFFKLFFTHISLFRPCNKLAIKTKLLVKDTDYVLGVYDHSNAQVPTEWPCALQ